MSRRVFWNVAIAVIGLLGSGASAPVLARGGHGPGISPVSHGIFGGAPRIATGRIVAGGHIADNRIGHDGAGRDASRRVAPILGWPYYPAFDAIPLDESDVQPEPQVIAVSGGSDPAASRTAPGTPSDYSFVAGCRVIPNGYHCDPPGHEAATH